MSYTKLVLTNHFDTIEDALADLVTNKSIAVLKDGALLTPAAALVDGSVYQLLSKRNTGDATDYVQTSVPFTKKDVVKVSKKAYAAGTAGSQVVNFVAETDGTAEYIKLIDITDGREKFAMVTAEGATAAEIVTAINAIGAKKGTNFEGVTATANVNAITVTFPLNKLYKVSANNASTFGTTTAPVLSVGRIVDVKADEKSALPFAGVTNLAGPNVVAPSTTTVAGNNYTKYTIMLEKTVGDRKDTHEIIIYCDTDNVGTTAAFEAELETLFAVTL